MSGMEALARAIVGQLSPRQHAQVGIDAPMWRVVDEMKAKRRGAVVVEDNGRLVGIFTERDLINRIDHADPLWSHVVVGDVMTRSPKVVHPSDSLAEALRRLAKGHVRHLPIVDDHGQLLGVMSIRDILSYIANRFPQEMVNLPPNPDHES